MHLKLFALATALLIAAAPAQALEGVFSSSSVEALGTGALTGELAAISLRGNSTANAPQIALQVDRGRIEVDQVGRTGSGATPVSRSESTETIVEGAFTVEWTQASSGYRVNMWRSDAAAPSVTATIPMTLTPPTMEAWTPSETLSRNRESVSISLENTLEVDRPTNAQAISIAGSFVVSVWSWNLTATQGGQQHEIWTGEESGNVDLSQPPSLFADGFQEAFIFVDSGALTINGAAPQEAIFVEARHLDVSGILRLREAQPLAGSTAAGNLTINGESSVEFHAVNGDAIEFDVTESSEAPIVDSAPTQPEPQILVPSAGKDPDSRLLTGVVFLMLLVAGAAVFLGDRYRLERSIQNARDALQYGVYDLASKAARVAQRTPRHRAEALVLGVTAVLRESGPEAAAEELNRARKRRIPMGLEDYLRATIHQTAGETEHAIKSLATSIQLDEAFRVQAASSEMLAPILYRLEAEPSPADGYS